MYQKLFIYSPQERKSNRIRGIFGEGICFLGCIPLLGIAISVISYFYRPLSGAETTAISGIALGIFMCMLVWRIIRYAKENVTTYAVDEKGQVLILNMSKNAASYMNLQNVMQQAGNAAGGKKVGMVMSAGSAVRETFENVNSDSDIQAHTGFGRVIRKIEKIESDTKKIVIYGDISGRKKYIIRRVYEDIGELERYLRYLCEGNPPEQFSFYKKTKAEDFIKKDHSNLFLKYSVRWSIFLLWFVMLGIASDIHTMAKVKHHVYVRTEAAVESVRESAEGKKWEAVVHYKAGEETIRTTLTAKKQQYEEGETVVLYYSDDEPNRYILKNEVGFHLYSYGVVWLFGEALSLIFAIAFKRF